MAHVSEKLVIVSGYFDPLHVGHLELFKKAGMTADMLLVIVNNDEQAKIKKTKSFMSQSDRIKIIHSIKYVDAAMISVDKDKTVCRTLERIAQIYTHHDIIFANGGDRNQEEIPEAETCRKYNIKMVDGLGEKIRSSSDYTGLK
tara:strand:- start:5187 stop:5618 length:432 start_codon:yes stop_codon:yes gene_type:complete